MSAIDDMRLLADRHLERAEKLFDEAADVGAERPLEAARLRAEARAELRAQETVLQAIEKAMGVRS
jgi:hypothetical protein